MMKMLHARAGWLCVWADALACAVGCRVIARQTWKPLAAAVLVLGVAPGTRAGTVADAFEGSVNYLTNGVRGTVWDGVYFGAGEFANSGVGGGGPGETLQCDANLTSAGKLTLQTTGTAWEGADDDGFFLYKVVKGNFSAVVRVVAPYDSTGYNTAGLQARAFSAGGDPFGGSEDYVSWTRFDQYGYANYLRNEVNGGVAQINPGDYPNSAYWLRLDRVGNVFRFYQRTNSSDAWRVVSFPSPVSGTNLTRSDLAGQPLQVGILHATFAGPIGVQFSDFSLTATNFDSWATPPSAATGLTATKNGTGGMDVSWTPGAGSAGSVVVVWAGENPRLQQAPANGFTYTGHAGYGLGSPLPAAGYFVVYSGAGTSVAVSNLELNATYHVAVFAYAGSGNATAYNRTPPIASLTIPPNDVVAEMGVEAPDVRVTFSANPGKWYWLQFCDSLSTLEWQNLGAEPVLANAAGMVLTHVNGALAAQRFYRLQEMDPLMDLETRSGAVTSLQRTGDAFPTEYIAGGKRLGDAILKYRPATSGTWRSVVTSTLDGVAASTNFASADGTQSTSRYLVTGGLAGTLVLESVFTFKQDALLWGLRLTNLSSQAVVLGDLALPVPMNMSYSGVSSCAMKHSFIAGHGSFLFWMRPNSVGPYLLMTPDADTKLEFWDMLNGYEAYIHSYVAGTNAAAQYPAVTTQGDRWRQPHTSLTLAAGGSQAYGFKFQWADDYDGIRQALVNEGKIDVHVVPGTTVPTNLFVQLALNTTQEIASVQAEFPAATQIQSLGARGTYHLYQVQFSRLGENKLTVQYGGGQTLYLEFFVTEPLETLIKKRAAFLAGKQDNDASKWYDGLFAEWNMNSQELITPDHYGTISGWLIYEVASDDSGLSRPAYLAAKNAVFPLQSEVTALDHYLAKFVWGGLQRTTSETYAYGIYGIPDWYSNRTSTDPGTGGQLHLWRIYDYPHIVVTYYGMYQVAKYHPEVTTALTAAEYLRRAYGTANALFTVPAALVGWSAYYTGLMNEMVIPDLIDALVAEGMTTEADTLRSHWETKVNYFVAGDPDLFGSEYAFDSTGFEFQQACARYAVEHAGSSLLMGSTNPAVFLQQAQEFMDTQITANVFDRGWLETAYYHYGSDFRSEMGDSYVVTYMSQMGGWGLLDYALHFATNAADYLRLGYASYLNGWSTMNSGTADSGYGFWYPGAANDGACGGGFEAAPYNTTWLGQPMHRGAWYYSCEQNLGYCAAVRSAATILADDPVFGRFCYGGAWQQAGGTNQIVPLDGVRRRFHAMLNSGKLHLVLDNDHFAAGQPIVLNTDLSRVAFTLETGNTASHQAILHFTASAAGSYSVSGSSGLITTLNLQAGQEAAVGLPLVAGGALQSFVINKGG